jgi:hypothetical protein
VFGGRRPVAAARWAWAAAAAICVGAVRDRRPRRIRACL